MHPHRPIAAWTHGDRITGVVVRGLESGRDSLIEAPFFIDATPLRRSARARRRRARAGGRVPRRDRRAARAPSRRIRETSRPSPSASRWSTSRRGPHHRQAARSTSSGASFEPPGWPGPPAGLDHRAAGDARAADALPVRGRGRSSRGGASAASSTARNFEEGFARSDITVVNWPQNDYWFGPVVGVDPAERAAQPRGGAAAQPQPALLAADGGAAARRRRRATPGCACAATSSAARRTGSRRRPTCGSRGGSAPSSRCSSSTSRIRSRPDGPELFPDSVGIGCYRIDLHPRISGAGYLDLGCWPFQIPLGAMIPVRVENLLPGGKNLGVTHITNGAFRVHPVEWNVGEAAGILAAFCLERKRHAASGPESPGPSRRLSVTAAAARASSSPGHRSHPL